MGRPVLIDYDGDGEHVHIEFDDTDIPIWLGDTTKITWEGVGTIEGRVVAVGIGGGHASITVRMRNRPA